MLANCIKFQKMLFDIIYLNDGWSSGNNWSGVDSWSRVGNSWGSSNRDSWSRVRDSRESWGSRVGNGWSSVVGQWARESRGVGGDGWGTTEEAS